MLIVLLCHDSSTKFHENLPTSSKTVGQGKDGLIGCMKYYHYKKYLLGLELLVKFKWNRHWNIIRPDESTVPTEF